MTLILPSYDNGFAPRDDEPLYPELWKGVIGAWSPSLGPTGGRLLDHGPFKNHGVLTNMDPATDWVSDGGRHALDFDGTNDYVEINLNLNVVPTVSFSAWLIIRNVSSSFGIFGNDNFNWGRVIRGSSTSTTASFSILNATGISGLVGSVPLNKLFHLHVLWSTSRMKLAINGLITSTAAGEASVYDDAPVINIGRTGPSGAVFLLNGVVYESVIHNRELTQNEIMTLYRLGSGGIFTPRRRRLRSYHFIKINEYPRTRKAILLLRSPVKPSFDTGFTPRDGEPLYPELWKGVVGAWSANLGPTGSSLLDHSPYKNHGALTNMDPATDWVADGGQHALDFDGIDDSVKLGSLNVVGNNTCAGWIRIRTLNRRHILFGRFGIYALFIESSNKPTVYAGVGLLSANNVVVQNEWIHLASTTNRTSGISTIYVNGILRGTASVGTTPISGQFSIGDQFQNRESTDGQISEVQLWNRELTSAEILRLYNIGRGGLFAMNSPKKYYTTIARKPISKASLVIRPPIEPSYDNGFAPRDGEPLYPELWRGVVGAWSPSLGPTGARLLDHGPFKNHGTLTNMDAATDWVIDRGQYALDFDGSNDYINAGASGGARLVGPPLSVSAWVNGRQLNQSFQGIVSRARNVPYAFSLRCDSGRVDLITDGSILSSATNISANAWFHVAVVLGVSLREIYINGKSSTRSTAAYTIAANSESLYIGADYDAGSASRLWNGLISDVVIWHRVLTANDVRRNYELGPGGMFTMRPNSIRPTSQLSTTWVKNNGEWNETEQIHIKQNGLWVPSNQNIKVSNWR